MEDMQVFESEDIETFLGDAESFSSGSSNDAPLSGDRAVSNFGNAFSYKQIGSITTYIEPVSGAIPLDSLVDMFKADSNLKAIPVEKNDRVVGIIDRKTVAEATSSIWRRLSAKTVGEYVKEVNALLSASDYIEKKLQSISAISKETGVEVFPVFNGRAFFGLVSLDEFLSRIADIREKDLQKAAVIQTSQFPSADELKKLPYSVSIWNRMANTLGGDMYQAHIISETESLIGCFDVSGKNVAASLLTISVSSFFKMLNMMPSPPRNPLAIISLLDEYLATSVPGGNFITGALCYFDVQKQKVAIFNCGHTNVFVCYQDAAESENAKSAVVSPRLPPLGLGEVKAQLAQEEKDAKKKPFIAFGLKHGIHIELYSDGFTDMVDVDSKRYEEERVKEFFVNLYSTPYQDVCKKIEETVCTYTAGTVLPDDIVSLRRLRTKSNASF